MKKLDISVIIPTYNESQNIIPLLKQIQQVLKHKRYEIVVIDDRSQDKTFNTVKKTFQKNKHIRCYLHTGKRDLGRSIFLGIKKARGNIIIGMDADFNHDPYVISSLLANIKLYDLVIANRFEKGGGMDDKKTYVFSYLFNFILRLVFGFPTMDNTSGFYAIKNESLKKLRPERIYYGYGEYHMRLVYMAKQYGFSIGTVPVYYHKRLFGLSKSRHMAMLIQYLKPHVYYPNINSHIRCDRIKETDELFIYMSIKQKMKYAAVTGASTGIGRAVAQELGKHGYTVLLIARRRDELEKTKQMVEEFGGKGLVFATDLTSIRSIGDLIKNIKKHTTRIDVLLNIAGIWHGENQVYADKQFEDFPKEVIVDTYTVGLLAPTLLTYGCIPLMTKENSIINLSGTFESGAKGWLPYYVSKRALEDLTVGLAEELKDKGIHVNCISPSDTATEQYKRFFPAYASSAQTPETIARFVFELIGKQVTGKVFVIKNGKVQDNGFHA